MRVSEVTAAGPLSSQASAGSSGGDPAAVRCALWRFADVTCGCPSEKRNGPPEGGPFQMLLRTATSGAHAGKTQSRRRRRAHNAPISPAPARASEEGVGTGLIGPGKFTMGALLALTRLLSIPCLKSK